MADMPIAIHSVAAAGVGNNMRCCPGRQQYRFYVYLALALAAKPAPLVVLVGAPCCCCRRAG
eukprot:217970-Lingulodinium_polyedra.AAC.1